FVAYQFVIGPLMDKGKQIEAKKKEIDKLETDLLEIQLQKRKFETARQQSLPNDPQTGVGVSRSQYTNLLEGLFRRAELTSGLKITVLDPDSKSAPPIAPKKPAYTKLNYDVTVRGELYHLVDFMHHFYSQPLLHQIKVINVQRPSDARSRGQSELDVNLKIEALVLDNAPARPTLLPVIREAALLSGAAVQTGMNMQAAASGRGSPVAPAGVLAESIREYLAIAGRNMFFGPPPPRPEGPGADDDHSPFITLTSIVGQEDGSLVAVFRDKLDNNNYTVTQSPKGEIKVKGEWKVRGNWKLLSGYSEKNPGRELFYGSEEGQNLRAWRVRRVTTDAVIMEKLDAADSGTKPKPSGLQLLGGGLGAFVAVPEGRVYKVALGHTLETDPRGDKPATTPIKYLLVKEAWKDIFAPIVVPAASESPTPASPARTAMRTEDQEKPEK
ncbi:MAG TPA: hypothetical protein VKD90_13295, partial [Gemmataceae bacterium]|nr:hypothetical protein [Gemmataceae bacterium]